MFKGYKKVNDEFEKCPSIPIRCSGITDNDPDKDCKPTHVSTAPGNNSQLYLIEELKESSENCRLFTNLKTFEYDLAMEGENLRLMAEIASSRITTNGPIKAAFEKHQICNWSEASITEKADAAMFTLNNINSIGKGIFAQLLASRIAENAAFDVPSYIYDAIEWLVDDYS